MNLHQTIWRRAPEQRWHRHAAAEHRLNTFGVITSVRGRLNRSTMRQVSLPCFTNQALEGGPQSVDVIVAKRNLSRARS